MMQDRNLEVIADLRKFVTLHHPDMHSTYVSALADMLYDPIDGIVKNASSNPEESERYFALLKDVPKRFAEYMERNPIQS